MVIRLKEVWIISPHVSLGPGNTEIEQVREQIHRHAKSEPPASQTRKAADITGEGGQYNRAGATAAESARGGLLTQHLEARL